MAIDSENNLDYFLLIEKDRESELAALRGWSHLWLATEGTMLWIKGFTPEQIESIEVKIIPFTTSSYSREGRLFPLHKMLPQRDIPSLLWTPIARALTLQRPPYNNHYFGISEKLDVELVKSEHEHDVVAMQVRISDLLDYVGTCAAIRLEPLTWTIINNDRAFVIGAPLLPIRGDAYWFREDMFLPAGYDLNYAILAREIYQMIHPRNDHWVIWNIDQTFSSIEKEKCGRLSRSAVRDSILKYSLSIS